MAEAGRINAIVHNAWGVMCQLCSQATMPRPAASSDGTVFQSRCSIIKKQLLDIVSRFFDVEKYPPESHPIAVLENMEIKAPARAVQGLRMAVNDCLEMCSHWNAQRLRF
ncbi:hypothetical protein ACL9RI_03935 [Janthinobacterium sp. Mn2066]|uniref:hypothetical protein n=1 Tax=Janthinobacterium sp. Mn2066 TaxID=3395264 RepID=UPI003BCBE181